MASGNGPPKRNRTSLCSRGVLPPCRPSYKFVPNPTQVLLVSAHLQCVVFDSSCWCRWALTAACTPKSCRPTLQCWASEAAILLMQLQQELEHMAVLCTASYFDTSFHTSPGLLLVFDDAVTVGQCKYGLPALSAWAAGSPDDGSHRAQQALMCGIKGTNMQCQKGDCAWRGRQPASSAIRRWPRECFSLQK